MKSGSAQADRYHEGLVGNNMDLVQNALGSSHFPPNKNNEDKELTAVRYRIGTLLSSNNVLDENATNELFKKDVA